MFYQQDSIRIKMKIKRMFVWRQVKTGPTCEILWDLKAKPVCVHSTCCLRITKCHLKASAYSNSKLLFTIRALAFIFCLPVAARQHCGLMNERKSINQRHFWTCLLTQFRAALGSLSSSSPDLTESSGEICIDDEAIRLAYLFLWRNETAVEIWN